MMQFLKGLTRWFHFNREPEPVRSHTGECGHEIVDGRHYPPEGGLVVECKQEKLLPELSRRGFLMGLGAAAVVAALPEIPLGRVWSIPKFIPGYMARFDEINRRTWGSVAWGNQSMALQIEHIRDKLPLLYEHDDAVFKMISTRSGMLDEVSAYAESSVREAMGEFRNQLRHQLFESEHGTQIDYIDIGGETVFPSYADSFDGSGWLDAHRRDQPRGSQTPLARRSQ